MIIDEGASASDSDSAGGSSGGDDDAFDWELIPETRPRRQRARPTYAAVARK